MPCREIAPRAQRFRIFWMMAARFALGVLVAGCSPSPEFHPLPQGARVVVLGDSLVAGYGLAPEKAWPHLLAERSGWRIENAGVSGNTSAQGLDRLRAILGQGEAPEAVMVLLGGNDMLRRADEHVTRNNLRDAIAAVRAAGAQPILIAVPRPSLGAAFLRDLEDADFYSDVAKETGTPLIGSVLSDVLSRPDNKLDRLHPNEVGQRKIAELMVAKLSELGFLRR